MGWSIEAAAWVFSPLWFISLHFIPSVSFVSYRPFCCPHSSLLIPSFFDPKKKTPPTSKTNPPFLKTLQKKIRGNFSRRPGFLINRPENVEINRLVVGARAGGVESTGDLKW